LSDIESAREKCDNADDI